MSSAADEPEPPATRPHGRLGSALRFGLLVAGLGVVTGLGAAGLTWILHEVEDLVYGHGEVPGGVLTDGVPTWRVSLGVAVVAIVLAVAWRLLREHGKPLAGVKGMIRGKPAPTLGTILNAAFQMVGVGAGLPVGREVAPRELAGMLALRVSERAKLDEPTRRLLIGAAAGAGLGAVYQVPLAGAVFVMELLLKQISTKIAATCLAMSAIAVAVSRLYINPLPQYAAPAVDGFDVRVLGWAIVVGLIIGPVGGWFGDLADHVKAHSQRGRWTLVTLPAAGLIVAALAYFLPQVTGNGRTAAQTAFLGMGLGAAAILLVAKIFATLLTLRAGAVGGTLAPAIAAGATAGIVIGRLAELAVPGLAVPATVLAVLGAAALLATSFRGPATGMLMIAGMTGQDHGAYAALALAVAAAFATAALRPALPGIKRG